MVKILKKYWAPILLGILILVTWLLKPKEYQEKNFLGLSYLPRGIRNNNPGNLVMTSIPWRGKIPNSQNTDGHFEQFENFTFGIRAMILDIRNDINLDGLNTLRSLINAYAPPHENNTENYLNILSSRIGIGPDDILGTDRESMRSLVKEIAKVENGGSYINDQDFNEAWDIL